MILVAGSVSDFGFLDYVHLLLFPCLSDFIVAVSFFSMALLSIAPIISRYQFSFSLVVHSWLNALDVS